MSATSDILGGAEQGVMSGFVGESRYDGNPYPAGTDQILASGNSAAGLPSSDQITATAPAPIQAFGALPTVDPTYTDAASMNPVYSQAATGQAASYNPAMATAQNSQAALSNPTQNDSYLRQYEQLLNTTMQPQFQAQNQNLQDSLAARGISSSGSAAYLQNQLSGQQASALASATSPLVQQGYGYTQADIAQNQANQQQTGLANQSAQNQFGLSNQAAQNAAGQTNSGYSQQANLFNAGNQQQTNLANQNAGMTAGATNAGYQQQANLANQGVANSASATNAGYYDQALTGNANAYNSYLQQMNQQAYGLQNSELSAYLNSFGPNTGVTSAMNTGLAGTQGAYSNALSGAQNQQNSMLGTLGTTYAAMGA